MKKGDQIYINSNTQKSQQRLNCWSENITNIRTLKAGTKLFHISEGTKLTSFAPCITCFSFLPCLSGYVYYIILHKDIQVDCVDDNEVRIDLSMISNKDITIVYVGTRIYTKIIKIDMYNRVQSRLKKFNFCNKYKKLQNKLNNYYKNEFQLTNYDKRLQRKIIKE